jgi:prepilin-type N-terminal cleavage/methylation domain-containing protein
MKRNGFTLIELLVVIVVVSILATLVVGGANYAVRVSREKRRVISCQTLQTAIYRYRTEYNEWPGGVTPSKNKKSHTFNGKENKDVLGMLRASDTENTDKIHFLDETAFFTPDNDGGAKKLSETTGRQPLVFVARSGRWTDSDGNYYYYRVTINFEDETVTVDTKGRNKDGKFVDLFYDEDDAESSPEED